MATEHEQNNRYPHSIEVEEDNKSLFRVEFNLNVRLGTGRFAYVVKGILNGETFSKRSVAVKVLQEAVNNDQDYIDLLIEEGKKLVEIEEKAPGIFVKVIAYNQTPDGPYIIQELLVKDNFVGELIKNDQITKDVFLDVILKVAQGLSTVYKKTKHTHRDLDTGAINYDPETGILKLIDCLPAKDDISDELDIWGSQGCIAPEIKIKGLSEIENKIDVYALGGVIYHMLTGKRRFNERNYSVNLEVRRNGLLATEVEEIKQGAIRLGLDPEMITKLVSGMVVRDPSNRSTMDEVAKVIEEVQAVAVTDDIPMDEIDTNIESVQGNKVTRLFSKIFKKIFRL